MDQSTDTGFRHQNFSVGWSGLILRTFALWKRRLPSYIGIMVVSKAIAYLIYIIPVFLIFGPTGLVRLPYLPSSISSAVYALLGIPHTPVQNILMGTIALIVTLLIQTVALGATIKIALEDYGNPGGGHVSTALSFSLDRFPTLIPLQILGFMVIMLEAPLALIDYVLTLFSMGFEVPLTAILLVGIVIIATYYIGIRVLPIFAIAIEEEQGVIGAVRTALNLTESNYWRIFAAQFFLSIGLSLVTRTLHQLLLPLIPSFILIHQLAVTIVSGLLITPILPIFEAVVYRDLKSRARIEADS